MSEFSKHILEQIKDEGIKPRPRWQFILMGVALGLSLMVSIVTGGLLMSLVFLKMFNVQWDLVSFAGERGLPNILEVLPLIWIGLLLVVLLLSVWAFEKTEKGYKYNPAWVVLGVIVLSAVLGGVLYLTKGAELFDEMLMDNFPPYEQMEHRFQVRFHLPEMGVLPGYVVEVQSPTSMQLEDLREHMWEVQLDRPQFMPPLDFNDLKEGSLVFVMGEKLSNDDFVAHDVRRKAKLPPPPTLKEILKNRKMGGQAQTRKVLFQGQMMGVLAP